MISAVGAELREEAGYLALVREYVTTFAGAVRQISGDCCPSVVEWEVATEGVLVIVADRMRMGRGVGDAAGMSGSNVDSDGSRKIEGREAPALFVLALATSGLLLELSPLSNARSL